MKLSSLYNIPLFITSGNIIFFESKDSTIILDLDETLIHITRPSIEIMSRMLEQSKDLDIRPQNIINLDSENGIKFLKALNNYNYKNYVEIFDHPAYKHALIIYRPGLCEFIRSLQSISNSELMKDIVIFTANTPAYARILLSLINKHCGSDLKLYDGSRLDVDSYIVDDDKNLGMIKMFKTGSSNNLSDASKKVLNIKKFSGDLNDNELSGVTINIKNMLKNTL